MLELALESVWKDGTRAILLEPPDLAVRVIAATPPSRFHLLRYFGVLSVMPPAALATQLVIAALTIEDHD